MPEQTVRMPVPGGVVAVRRDGSGPPVIFVHGAGGDGHNWDGVVERLRGRFSCVVVDRVGYGASSWHAAEPPDRETHGSHLRIIRSELGLDDACAVGTSAGALAILAALRREPAAFTGAVLIEPPLRIGESPVAAAPRPVPAASELEAAGKASIQRIDASAWEAMSPQDRQRYIASFAVMFRDTSQPPFVLSHAEAAALTLPLSVVYGSKTAGHFVQSATALAAELPNATLDVVEGAAHLMYLTHTDEVAGLIGSLLDRCFKASRPGAR